MVGDGIVVIPVRLFGLEIKLVIEHGEKHKHIGLFENTILLQGLHTQNGLVGVAPPSVLFLIERSKLEEAVKLLEQPGMRILQNSYVVSYVLPVCKPLLAEVEFCLQFSGLLWRSDFQPL